MILNSWQYFAADYYANLEVVAAVLAVLIIISGVDDLVIDVWYWKLRLVRWFTHRSNPFRPLTVQQLQERAEQPLAVMVPAWMEYDVIAAMIENMVKVLDYKNYTIFVGTYVNDAATIAEVERMRRRYKQLRRVEVPNPGPTCKADCLNWVVQAIFLHEQNTGTEFAGVILHDSEDVLHPLELKFYNYLLPRKDMIQLPVMSLERKWYELVAGTYMDEFAESHGKDMTVRENISGVVPSAGVGTCFSRKALLALNAETQNQPFNTLSLTEDYDIGNRLAHMGMRSIFAIFPVQFLVKQESWFSKRTAEPKLVDMPLCVREYFPDTFRTAYRQKARWTLGIGLQSWEQIKFTGSLAAKYLLLRDRKGVLTALISMLAYFLLIQFVVFQTAAYAGLWQVYYPPLFSMDGWWPYVMLFNGFALLSRMAHRIYFVTALYGWRHGLLSVPRMVVSNFVNFMAVARAWKLFLSYLFFGKAMVWDKTMHDFPSAENLVVQKQRIGELLRSWQAVDEHTLNKALEEQSRVQLPLGRVLVSNGWLDDETLAEVMAFQADLPRAVISAEAVNTHAHVLPAELCMRFRALCIGHNEQARPILGVASPVSANGLKQLARLLEPLQHIARESEVAAGLRLLRGESTAFGEEGQSTPALPLLGDLLIERGLVQRQTFEAAMDKYRPQTHGRIGDFLVNQGVISRETIEKVVAEQRQWQMPTGDAGVSTYGVTAFLPMVDALIAEVSMPLEVVTSVAPAEPVMDPASPALLAVQPVEPVFEIREVHAQNKVPYFYIHPAFAEFELHIPGEWQACDSIFGIIRSALHVAIPTVFLSFQRDSVVRELAEAVHMLRRVLGQNANIIVIEQNASLRYQSAQLLLRLGASLVVKRDVPPIEIPLLIETSMRLGNCDIGLDFDAALSSALLGEKRGYLPLIDFLQETTSTLDRSNLLNLPCVMVVFTPMTGVARDILAKIRVTRSGDVTTTDGERGFAFFSGCPESDVRLALQAVFGKGLARLWPSMHVLTRRSDIKKQLRSLAKQAAELALFNVNAGDVGVVDMALPTVPSVLDTVSVDAHDLVVVQEPQVSHAPVASARPVRQKARRILEKSEG
jgi:bacteriophage N4 adsorption protein B